MSVNPSQAKKIAKKESTTILFWGIHGHSLEDTFYLAKLAILIRPAVANEMT